jgi:GAF domain-containing protein
MCSVCNEPVKLETAKTNEDGHAVHADCYLAKISGMIAPKPIPKALRNNPYAALANSPQIAELLILIIKLTAADFGNVQLFDSSRSRLRIVAQLGFAVEFLNYFDTVCSGTFACGAAMNQHSRVIVSDVLTDPLFNDLQTQGVMLRANVRACQSTPLFDQLGNFIGVVSTHFQKPTSLDAEQWKRVDTVVAQFTNLLAANVGPSA